MEEQYFNRQTTETKETGGGGDGNQLDFPWYRPRKESKRSN